jgi:hypothetical protein
MLLPRHQESLHLREAGGVTAGLMEMGASLSPATYAIQENPVAAVAGVAGDPLQSDPLIYRVVVIVLGLVLIVATMGALVLTAYGLDIPDLLTALGSAAVGALAGVLTPLGGRS